MHYDEVVIYDARDGSVAWKGRIEEPNGDVVQITFPEGVTPAEAFDIYVDDSSERWRVQGEE